MSPPRPRRSRRSDPELVELALLDSGLWTLEPVGVAEELVVEPPRRPPRPEPISPKMLSLLLLEVSGVEAGVVDALAAESEEPAVEAVDEVFEFTPRRSPTSEPRSLRMLPLEEGVADEAGVVEASVEAAAAVAGEVAVAVVDVESTPRRPPRPEPISLIMLPLVEVVAAGVEVVADEAGTLETAAEAAEAAEAAVEVVESPPSSPPRPELISPKMLPLVVVVAAAAVDVVAEAGALEAAAAEAAEAAVEVVEPPTPRRSPTSLPRSPIMLPLELEVDAGVEETWAGVDVTCSVVGAAVEVAAAAATGVEVEVEVVESPPRRLLRPEPRSPRRLSLEVEAGALEALDESTAAACLLVLSVLAASVCWVVVVRVVVGSPPTVVVPVMRWVISGFLGSTEMVTTTTSCPCGSWAAAAEEGSGVGVTSGATELWVGTMSSKMLFKNEPGLLSALRALLRMVRLISLGK